MASLLFLRFGLLPFFGPFTGDRKKGKKKKEAKDGRAGGGRRRRRRGGIEEVVRNWIAQLGQRKSREKGGRRVGPMRRVGDDDGRGRMRMDEEEEGRMEPDGRGRRRGDEEEEGRTTRRKRMDEEEEGRTEPDGRGRRRGDEEEEGRMTRKKREEGMKPEGRREGGGDEDEGRTRIETEEREEATRPDEEECGKRKKAEEETSGIEADELYWKSEGDEHSSSSSATAVSSSSPPRSPLPLPLKPLMTTLVGRKLSRSTSELPKNWQMEESGGEEVYQRERFSTGGGESELNTQSDDCGGGGEAGGGRESDKKRRKKSFKFKICQRATNSISSEVLLLDHYPRRFGTVLQNNNAVLGDHSVPIIPPVMPMVNGSRFKIAPVESKYTRGRWEVWDYYDEFAAGQRKTIPAAGSSAHLSPPSPLFSPLSEKRSNLPPPQPSPQQRTLPAATAQTPSSQAPPGPGAMPRRNSFQLITILRNSPSPAAMVADERRNSSVPLVISEDSPKEGREDEEEDEEGEEAEEEEKAEEPKVVQAQLAAPQIVDPENGEIIDQRQRQKGADQRHPIPPAMTAKTRPLALSQQDPQLLSSPSPARHLNSSVVFSVAPSPPPADVVGLMKLEQFSSLERSLSISGQAENAPSPTGSNSSASPFTGTPASPQRQLSMSASFGPGQMQFDQQKERKASGEKRAANAAMMARRSSSASTGAVPSAQKGDGTVAIDSKIEQAMDLVKAHLIYAVRDEMELLRTKIGHLEATVVQLETENAILREHIPREILDTLPSGHVPHTAIAQ